MITHVIWDWNGTLLDDVDCSVATLNSLLAERGLPAVTRDEYRRRFGFPVRPYYEELGFDFTTEDYAALSHLFIERYRCGAAQMRLWRDALDVLAALRGRGVRNLVVSAMETELLATMLGEHGVRPWLDGHHGLADRQAGSKLALGAVAVSTHGLDPERVVLVGDTLHDLELARAIGCRAILFAGGHQSRDRLAATGAPIVERLEEVLALVDAWSGRGGTAISRAAPGGLP